MAATGDSAPPSSGVSSGAGEDPLPILHRSFADPSAFDAAVWHRVFNRRRPARAPRAVVRATSPAHVRAAVRLAAREGCRLSVRSGGHSWAAWSVRDDAVLVDLAGLDGAGGGTGVTYEEGTGVVACPPGATGRELNEELGRWGRMFAGGHCPDVGLGGFLLQGGMGWNCKNWGWACESVEGVDVVTADAQELHCSATENADLFWAARGAGPGFPAIVTRFYLATRPVREMYQSLYFYPMSEYRTVLQWVIDLSPTADPDTEIVAVAQYLPDDDSPTILANFLTFKPSQTAGLEALSPIHASRPPGAQLEVFCAATSLAEQYTMQTKANPLDHRYSSDNAYVADDSTREVDVPGVLEAAFTSLPTRQSSALYFAMSPGSRRQTMPDMALSMQSDHYFAVYAVWADEKDDERCEGWVADAMKGVERHAVGSYLGDADFQRRRTRFWSEEAGRRLREVRRRWDPEGRICGYLDVGDRSGVDGLRNEFEWEVHES
ncbi:FAD binding domain protein [Pleurostoma richardsiae]|uniref:FAD binding domain protein n=1 Tax=Pleurostoma richardsiae TaxID=41990 RepID=A0AA38RAQ5_9PEZI|nr:FAD binding domain protein [Pleurostoma richardsiae]